VVSIVLDTRFNVKAFHLVAIGPLSQVLFEPREILRPAVAVSGARFVAMHNHPSGDPRPSDEDLAITWRLVRAGQVLGIPLLDHVIIGAEDHYSFRAKNPDMFGCDEEGLSSDEEQFLSANRSY
jgi:DNA repair protein RadC